MSTVTKLVWAKLWNEQHDYNVQLNLELRELWGQKPFPDGYAVERVHLVAGIGVEDGDYTLEYSFNHQQEKAPVRVHDGLLMNPAA